ncbi:hypothetical protein FJZ53_06795 [Candidatus Woesearchaeota archaeon]|nr:hypothetical protein [Candidatus Woesearchaeota archaeon]
MKIKSIDPMKCTGCFVCQQTCSFSKTKELNNKKSSLKLKREHIKDIVLFCTQCGACAKKCIKKAIEKKGDIYVITKKCDGCGDCLPSCPFKLIFLHNGKAVKCDGCGTCAEWCPVKAIIINKGLKK